MHPLIPDCPCPRCASALPSFRISNPEPTKTTSPWSWPKLSSSMTSSWNTGNLEPLPRCCRMIGISCNCNALCTLIVSWAGYRWIRPPKSTPGASFRGWKASKVASGETYPEKESISHPELSSLQTQTSKLNRYPLWWLITRSDKSYISVVSLFWEKRGKGWNFEARSYEEIIVAPWKNYRPYHP